MTILKWLESIRTPWMDEVMSILTQMGDETIFMVLGMAVIWCLNKRWGFRFMLIGLTGTAMNQLLKAIFLVPRPWVLDPEFTIVESAREGASGYSFPSGHTQAATTCFGTLAAWLKRRWVTAVCVAGIIIVAFSRMYLGVHTPMDVGVSLVTGTLTVLVMTACLEKGGKAAAWMKALGVLLALALLGYVHFAPQRAANVAEFDAHGVKAAWQVTGAMAGLMLAWWLDEKYIHFNTDAVLWAQICKIIIGLGLVLAVRTGLKPVMSALFGEAMFAHGIRYFLMTVMGGILWPLTFRFWSRIGKNKTEAATINE